MLSCLNRFSIDPGRDTTAWLKVGRELETVKQNLAVPGERDPGLIEVSVKAITVSVFGNKF